MSCSAEVRITRPDPGLSEKEVEQVKRVARDLLATLKREKLVLDWRKRQQTRAAVQLTIETALDAGLPAIYTAEDYNERCTSVYQHVFDSYDGPGAGRYAAA